MFKGELSLYADDQKVATISGDRKFCDIFRGDILGEMSLIDVEPASATVRAVTKVGIWSMETGGLRCRFAQGSDHLHRGYYQYCTHPKPSFERCRQNKSVV